jgi:hypothetical protein
MSKVRGWQLLTDWSGGGGYTGPLEDVTNYVGRSDVVATYGRPTDSVSQVAPTGTLDFSLINRTRTWDRYFSPENASSPIYGKVLPGRPVQLTRTGPSGRTIYSQDFATGLDGWTFSAAGTATRVASPSEDSNGSLQYVPNGVAATAGVYRPTMIPFSAHPEGPVLATARVRATVTFTDCALVVDWYNSAGTFLSTSGTTPLTTLSAGVWTTVSSLYLTPPATATQLQLRLRLGSTPPATTTFNMDWVSLYLSPNDADREWVVHAGILDDFNVDSHSAARTFSGNSLDAFGRPQTQKLSTLVWPSIRTGDAINLVLTDIGWTGDKSIDKGATIIPYWWEEGTDPAEAIEKLVKAEGPPAIAYVKGGVFYFRDRHHRIRNTVSTTSQGTFSLIVPAGSGPGYDYKVEKGTFEYDHGIKSIVNRAEFSVDQRRPADTQEVWASESPVAMNSGDSTTFFAELNDPAINVGNVAYLDVASGSFTSSLDRSSGQKIIITLTCVTTGQVNRIALRGNPLPIASTVQVATTDPASIAKYGASSWPEELPWAGVYDAQAIGSRIVAAYADNRPRVSFTIVNFSERYTAKMLSLDIGHRITIRNDVLGVNRDFFVEQLEHRISRWQVHRLTVSAVVAEDLQPDVPFTFSVAGRGFNDGQFSANVDSAKTMFLFDVAGQGFNQGQFAT